MADALVPGRPGSGEPAQLRQAVRLRTGYCREMPDVSASADPVHGYESTTLRAWGPTGGTSAAAPLWASLAALIDVDPATLRPVGFLNPALYSLGVASAPQVVNDVTVGNDDYTTTNDGLYPATPGYDMASGLGTPIGRALRGGARDGAGAGRHRALPEHRRPVTGGTAVTITGTGLAWASAVDFGRQAAHATSRSCRRRRSSPPRRRVPAPWTSP